MSSKWTLVPRKPKGKEKRAVKSDTYTPPSWIPNSRMRGAGVVLKWRIQEEENTVGDGVYGKAKGRTLVCRHKGKRPEGGHRARRPKNSGKGDNPLDLYDYW